MLVSGAFILRRQCLKPCLQSTPSASRRFSTHVALATCCFSTRAGEAARCHRCWPSYLPLLHLRQLPLGAQDALAPEVRIGTVQGEQLIVCALFLNGPRRIQNDDLIGHLDGLQLVGDGNHRR